jgi:secreted trypsin-like serine protease
MRALRAVVALAAAGAVWAGATAPAGAAPEPTAGASVVGGQPASIAEFPSVAYIVAGQGYGVFGCTGSVVAPRLVLTAGHCVDNVFSLGKWRIEDFHVTTGVADNSNPPSTDVSQVTAAIPYSGFDPFTLHGDAGLLVLAQPVAAPPIPLASPAAPVPLAPGTPLQIAGWGLTGAENYPPPTVLRTGTIATVSSGYCARNSGLPYSPSLQICGADLLVRKAAICSGDSGGAALVSRPDGTKVEVGIASASGLGCGPTEPNIFTRVEAISDWIQGWIAAVEKGTPMPVGPQAEIPRMTGFQAAEIEELTLAEVLLKRFTGKDLRRGCRRLGRARVRCEESWVHGRSAYTGAVTSFWAIEENHVALRGSYLIRSTTRRCASGPDPKSCPVRTLRG